MTLKAMMSADIDSVFFNTGDFAYTVSYKFAATGTTKTDVRGIPDVDVTQSPTDYGVADLVSWQIPMKDVAKPEMYDEITYGSTTYIVQNTRQGDLDGTWIAQTQAEKRQKPGNVR